LDLGECGAIRIKGVARSIVNFGDNMSFRSAPWAALLMLSLFDWISFAQETFNIRNASSEYDLKVQVKDCGSGASDNLYDRCSGPGRVSVYRKGAKAPFQVLSLSAIEVYKDRLAFDPELTKKARKPNDDRYSSFIFGDFNFDGMKDLAICNGTNGGYGGQSYTVYLFNSRMNKFVENRQMSELTEASVSGLFSVEAKQRLLVVLGKSGSRYHQTEKYRVVANRPVLVEEIIYDLGDSEDFTVVTTRKLVNGKWVKRERKVKNP
jgi:hypothetical protein